MMSKRVRRLREQSVSTRPYISTERAELLTDFYRSGAAKAVSTPVARALAFKYLLENKTICINDGELIVGERGPAPKATPTYPELCCHTLEDLEVLNSRRVTPFLVSQEAKKTYREKTIPFWKGKTMRERVFAAMPVRRRRLYRVHGAESPRTRHTGREDLSKRTARLQAGYQDCTEQYRPSQ